jgi:L-Ala-D/L-Glu epimerase
VLRRIDRRPFVGRMTRAAVESALVELLACVQGRSVASWLMPTPRSDVAVNALLGIAAPDVTASEARRLVDAGYGCLKLKGGNEAVAALVRRVAAVRDAVGGDVALRLDLNGTLDTRSAADVLERLTPFGLDYVEQPIALTSGVGALARLRRRSAIPIAADESVRDVGTARALLRAAAADVLVVKPSRVGGLRQARSIVELAEASGVPVTVSTLFETGVGIAAALQLAATVSGDQAHGLATAELLVSDLLARPLAVVDGRMAVPPGPGLGVTLDEAAVERFRVA